MLFTQFHRIERHAGGVAASNREFIRAAHRLLGEDGRTRSSRDARHEWLREGLALRVRAARLAGVQA